MKNREKTAADLRRFGLVMAAPLALIGGFLLWRSRPAAPWVLGMGAVFLVLGLAAPGVLRPVERGWMAFAMKVSIVSTFVLLGLSYFLIVTPIAIVLRLLGKDRLSLKPDPARASYWEPVEAGGPATRPDKPY
jgi:hypothetical protein